MFELPDGRAVGYGEWGPIDGWRRKKPEYWHIKKSYSPIHIITREIKIPDSEKSIKIELGNWHDFTNLSELDIEWSLGDENGKVNVDIAPKEDGIISIRTKNRIQSGQKLKLSFHSPRGFIVDAFELPIGKVNLESMNFPPNNSDKYPFELISENNNIIVRNQNQEWIIDRQNGKIISGSQNGKIILLGGPHLMMLPLISGPCNTEHSREISPYNDICTNWSVTDVKSNQTDNGFIISVTGIRPGQRSIYL